MSKKLFYCLASAIILMTSLMEARAETEEVVLNMEGFSCPMCCTSAQKTCEEMKGVNKAQCDFKSKTMHISYDKKKVGIDQLKAALGEKGFKATVVETR